MTRIIFIAGVSGVGKSRLLQSWASAHSEARVLSAGRIIGEARERLDPEFLRALSTEELTRSQQLLVAGFEQMRTTLTADLIVLDGHVLIERPSGEFYEIPTQTFCELGVHGIVHLENDVATIVGRRIGDSKRARPLRSAEELGAYQQASRVRAQRVADELGVWLRVQSSDDAAALEQVLATSGTPAI
jgi:adenylate kinase